MRPTTVTIYNESGEHVDIAAFTTVTPGLVVHLSNGDPGWIVTHQRSGLLVMGMDNPEQAQAAAADLADVTDWTSSGDDIVSDRHVALGVYKVGVKWGADKLDVNENRETYAERLSA